MLRLNPPIACLCAALSMAACASTPERPAAATSTRATAPTRVTQSVKKAPDVSVEAKNAFAKGVAAYRGQRKSGRFDYDALLANFQTALQRDPNLAEAHYNLGCIYEAMREDDKAQVHYQTALQIRPDLALAAANWGALLARRGKLNEALSIYQKALRKEAKNSPVLLNMAAIYQQQKKHDLAIQRASEVLVRDPTNIGAYRVMASVYYDMGKMDMARLICLRGLKVKENDPSLLNTLGLVLLKLKKVPDALARFRAALSQQPDMLPTRFNIAKVALDYRDFRVARGEFAKILQYEPDNRQAAVGLGIAMRGMGDIDAAKIQFNALAKKHQRDPVAHQWLCRLELRNFSKPAAAKRHCQRCIALLGDRPAEHPCVAMHKEAVQGIEMQKKMKQMEAKALREQRRLEAKLARLANLRKETVDKAWERAEKRCDVLPPRKLEDALIEQAEFVLDPLAVTPNRKTKVRLVGALFGGVQRVNLGTIRVEWRRIDEHTLEMVVPKGIEEGGWDVLITRKDKSELFLGGGLWVGKKPKCGAKKSQKGVKAGRGSDATVRKSEPKRAAGVESSDKGGKSRHGRAGKRTKRSKNR